MKTLTFKKGADSLQRPDGTWFLALAGRALLAAVGVLTLAGCTTIKDKIAGIEYPNPAPDPVPVESGLIAAGTFARPVIALDGQGRLQIAVEGPKMQSLHLYTLDAGKWQGGEIVKASKETAMRCYVADLAPGVVSWRWGKKDGGVLHGPGLYVAGQILYPGLTHGAARLAEHGGVTYLMSKDGAWGRLDAAGAITAGGTFPAGSTGEKFDFVIDAAGRWHTAHNGYSAQASAYAVGTAAGGKRVTWADHKAYPGQGDDLCYPSILAVDGRAYIVSAYSGQVRVQIMRSDGPTYPINALPSLGSGTQEQRCPPRLIAAPGGVLCVWRRGKDIVAVDVAKRLAGQVEPRILAQGEYPAGVVGPDDILHLVFVGGGGLQYRKINW